MTSLGATIARARLPVSVAPDGDAAKDAEAACLLRAAVVGVTLEQELHRGYELRIEVLAPGTSARELLDLRGKAVRVGLDREAFLPHVIGIVHRVRAVVTDLGNPVRYELLLRPGAVALNHVILAYAMELNDDGEPIAFYVNDTGGGANGGCGRRVSAADLDARVHKSLFLNTITFDPP